MPKQGSVFSYSRESSRLSVASNAILISKSFRQHTIVKKSCQPDNAVINLSENDLMRSTREFRKAHDYPCWCGHKDARVFCSQMFGKRPSVALECSACHTHRMLPPALND